MAPIADGSPHRPPTGSDPVRRAAHVALALYLTPVVAFVCLIGAAAIVIGKATRAGERLVFGEARHAGPGPIRVAGTIPGRAVAGIRGRRAR